MRELQDGATAEACCAALRDHAEERKAWKRASSNLVNYDIVCDFLSAIFGCRKKCVFIVMLTAHHSWSPSCKV